MKNMKTISEYEILNMARYTLLDRWLRELELQDKAKAEGTKNTIAKIKAQRYREQLDEIEGRMKEIEETA